MFKASKSRWSVGISSVQCFDAAKIEIILYRMFPNFLPSFYFYMLFFEIVIQTMDVNLFITLASFLSCNILHPPPPLPSVPLQFQKRPKNTRWGLRFLRSEPDFPQLKVLYKWRKMVFVSPQKLALEIFPCRKTWKYFHISIFPCYWHI